MKVEALVYHAHQPWKVASSVKTHLLVYCVKVDILSVEIHALDVHLH